MGGYSGGSEKFFSGLLEEGEAGRNDEAEVAPPPLSGHAYTYDGENRLTRVTNATTSAVALEIEYDALGRRVASTESTGATSDCVSPPVELRHIYLGLATIEEHLDCGTAWDLAREFLWGDNFPEPLVMIDHTNTAGQNPATADGVAYELPSLFTGRGRGRVESPPPCSPGGAGGGSRRSTTASAAPSVHPTRSSAAHAISRMARSEPPDEVGGPRQRPTVATPTDAPPNPAHRHQSRTVNNTAPPAP